MRLFPSLTILTHPLLLLLVRGQLTSTSWHLSPAVPAATGLVSACQFPSAGSHRCESSSPLVNCKLNFSNERTAFGSDIIRSLVCSPALRVGREWRQVIPNLLTSIEGPRAPGKTPWEGQVSWQACLVLSSVLRFCTSGSVELEWQLEHIESNRVQNFSLRSPIYHCLRFMIGPQCGANLPAASDTFLTAAASSIGLEKLHGASQDLSPSLLKIKKDLVHAADFGVRGSNSLG